jgi:hypothetical protein
MPSGIYVRTPEMKTGKCESVEKRKEITKDSWKSEEVRQKRILGIEGVLR